MIFLSLSKHHLGHIVISIVSFSICHLSSSLHIPCLSKPSSSTNEYNHYLKLFLITSALSKLSYSNSFCLSLFTSRIINLVFSLYHLFVSHLSSITLFISRAAPQAHLLLLSLLLGLADYWAHEVRKDCCMTELMISVLV